MSSRRSSDTLDAPAGDRDVLARDYTAKPPTAPARILAVPAELAGSRVDQALARLLPEQSRSRIQSWIAEGLVLIDGAPCRASGRVWGGEQLQIRVPPPREETAFAPEAIALAVVYEDTEILVLDKPPGLVVHPGSGNWSGTLLNALLHHAPELARLPRAGIVHRLDKDTSGLMVVARTPEAQTSLTRQLKARTVRREYLALVVGVPPESGTVDAPVGRHPVHRTRMAVVGSGRGAVTHYERLEALGCASLVRCRLETGRTHQIRVHMQSIGHPLLGDPTYGGGAHPAQLLARQAGFRRQALHAAALALVHPRSGEAMRWEAPMPADMQGLLERLRRQAEPAQGRGGRAR